MKIFKKTAKYLFVILLAISWVFQYSPGTFWKNFGGLNIPEARAATTGNLVPVLNGGVNTSNAWTNAAGTACAIDGTNCYTQVADTPGSHDGDTSYIRNPTTTGTQDVTFNLDISSIPNGSTITQVDITFVCRSDSSQTITAQSVRRIDGALTAFGTNVTCPASASYSSFTQSHTGLNITKTATTDFEVGVRKVQARAGLRVTSIYANITYTPPTTTLGSGTDPASATVAPESGIRDAGAFTFQTNSGTDSVTALTVSLAAAGTPYEGLSEVRITSNDGATTYFTAISNPTSNTLNFSGGTPIPVSTTQTQFKIQVTPKTHAAMPAPPGAEYNLSPRVTGWTGTNTQAGSDSNANTLTIDNLSPAAATGAGVTAGDAQLTISWTNPGDADFSNVVVVRATAANTGTPAEGSSPALNDPLGNGVVRYTGSGSSFIDTGLTNGTTYFYKIWAKDTRGNYAATAPETSGTPRTTTVRGAAFNTIMWQGSQPAGTAVKFQIASSNCSNGATNPPTCDTGTWTFRGPDGTASTFYAPAGPNVPVMLNPSYHNNHRYVRYRIYLQPDASNTNTPRVDDVIITWSR